MLKNTKEIKRKIENFLLRVREYPLQSIEKRVLAKAQPVDRTIPSIIYQTWVNNLFGKTHFSEIKKFRELNPDMEFNLFDSEDLEKYMLDFYGEHPIYQVFKHAKFGPMKADIFRYCILHERGGYYFDIKGGISTSISKLFPADFDGVIAYEQNDCHLPPNDSDLEKIQHTTKYVLNWGIGFSKGHPILAKMISDICNNYPFYKDKLFENPKTAILAYTSIGKFTQVVRNEIANNPNIKVYQAGIDFNGFGIYSMKGAKVRFLTSPAYTDFSFMKIVD